jgi:hypothetical protein
MDFRSLAASLRPVVLAAIMSAGVIPLAITGANATQSAPTSIRVGQSCSCTSCNSVVTVSMETYVKRVLPNEWISSWNAESLKAGAVAIRSFAAYYHYHPLTSSYDICNNTCCQVYSTTQYTSTNNAVDATAGMYLVDGSTNIQRAEYSAENNDSTGADGCGNCYTSDKPNDGICLSDSVCCGYTKNGHGRGMCQWGSQRWAANRGETYSWILHHYYDAYGWSVVNLTSGGSTPVTIVVDNSNSGFSASSSWSTGSSSSDKYGSDYRFRSTQAISDAAQWTANITVPGSYTVSAWWPQGSNRSATAPFILPSGATSSQNEQGSGGQWNALGTVSLAAGNAVTKLSCWTTAGYVVVADAVKYYKP